jgi:hypothetical protein
MEPGEVHEAWRWIETDVGPACVGMHLGVIDGRPELIGVEVWAVPPERSGAFGPHPLRPLRSKDLRFALDQLVQSVRASALKTAQIVAAEPDFFSDKARASARRAAKLFVKKPGTPGRPVTYGPEHFAEVARIYREAFEAGPAPTKAVTIKFDVSYATASKWVARARAAGLLPATERGRARAVEPDRKRRKR